MRFQSTIEAFDKADDKVLLDLQVRWSLLGSLLGPECLDFPEQNDMRPVSGLLNCHSCCLMVSRSKDGSAAVPDAAMFIKGMCTTACANRPLPGAMCYIIN